MTMAPPRLEKGGGAGVLDKPIIEKTTPGRESEFDLRFLFHISITLFTTTFYKFKNIIKHRETHSVTGNQEKWHHHIA